MPQFRSRNHIIDLGFESSFQTVFRIFLEYIVCFEIEKIQEISGIFKMLIFAGM
jgi:hypothetical protein